MLHIEKEAIKDLYLNGFLSQAEPSTDGLGSEVSSPSENDGSVPEFAIDLYVQTNQ